MYYYIDNYAELVIAGFPKELLEINNLVNTNYEWFINDYGIETQLSDYLYIKSNNIHLLLNQLLQDYDLEECDSFRNLEIQHKQDLERTENLRKLLNSEDTGIDDTHCAAYTPDNQSDIHQKEIFRLQDKVTSLIDENSILINLLKDCREYILSEKDKKAQLEKIDELVQTLASDSLLITNCHSDNECYLFNYIDAFINSYSKLKKK